MAVSHRRRVADVLLVNPSAAGQYKCSICHCLLHEPLQVGCGHRGCKECFAEEMKKPDPKCPEDHIPLQTTEMFRDVSAEKEIQFLDVFCTSKRHSENCSWTGKRLNLEAHEEGCLFVLLRCTNGKCTELVQRNQLSKHTRVDCQHRSVVCQFCLEAVEYCDLSGHQRLVCELADILCPNNCGDSIQRRALVEHRRLCRMEVVCCTFSDCGCRFEGTRASLESHLNSNTGNHLAIVRREQLKDRELTAEHSSSINVLMKVVEQLKEKMEGLERNRQPQAMPPGPNSGFAPSGESPYSRARFGRDASQDELLQVQASIITEQQQRAAIERTVAQHAIQLSDLGMRQDLEELKSSSGTLIWKLSQFYRRQQDAISKKTLSLYSPPFYTSPCGYKMCARLYPNGDGVGHGTHLSLFFVVMKGEYDALLQWPFRQKISLMLLDQSPYNPRHVVETFRPDGANSSYRRPESELNVATGCPLFLPLNALYGNSTYVVDDTVFFKIVVHKEGLVPPDSTP